VLEDVETGQSRVVVCNEYQTFEDRELYVISAMNRKLYYFPDFAAAINMSSVSDCDEARAFVQGYHAYRDAHPHFDANQPRSPAPLVPDDPDLQSATVTATVTKLGNGTEPGAAFAFPNESVVLLETPGPNRIKMTGGACSGTFIAKNWILTAAHCMNVLKDSKGRTTIDGNTQWTITWSDAMGVLVSLFPDGNSVKQLSDGAFIDKGVDSDPDHDVALLYLDKHVYDDNLPPVTENGAAMRISLSPPKSSDVSSIAGWGLTNTLTWAPAGTLVASSVKDFSFGYTRSSSSDGQVCPGDSGGPLYRNQTVGTKTFPVLVGVTSSAPGGDNCNPVRGQANFARIDLAVESFIDDTMNLIYGTDHSFLCREFNTNSADAYAECWGTPCMASKECTGTNYCSRPGSVLNGEYNAKCPICNVHELQLGTTCDCVFGQCLSPLSTLSGF
jgi:hypothetical protein